MRHPQSGVVQQASSDAYERLWRGEGWVIVEEPPAPEADGRLVELRAEADALGLKVHPNAKAETIERKIAEARMAE